MNSKQENEIKEPTKEPSLDSKNPIIESKLELIKETQVCSAQKNETKQRYFKRCNTECKLFAVFWKQRGYLEVPDDQWEDWDVVWHGAHIDIQLFPKLKPHQKVNHFPRTTEVTRKDKLVRNLNRMRESYPNEYSFFPQSWIWPLDSQEFLKHHQQILSSDPKASKRINWISKPTNLSRGRGISLHSNQIDLTSKDRCVIQQYILNPFLIDNLKFDLRLYVIVTSFQPLRVYLYNDGLVRFATETYDPNPSSKDIQRMHLTNFSINRGSSKFVYTEESNTGSKWLFSALLEYLKKLNLPTDKLLHDIHDLVTKTLISVEPEVSQGFASYVPYRWNCFEMFGFDILVDENLKPWLLEVNLSPSMSCSTPIDTKLKHQLMFDFYWMNNTIEPTERPQNLDKNETLIWELETEEKRKRNFTRVFPKADSLPYLQFFEVPKPENAFLIKYLASK